MSTTIGPLRPPTSVCTEDMNWIISQKLAVGNMDAAADESWLVKNHIGGVVSVRGRLSKPPAFYKRLHIQVLHIPVSDSEDTNLGKYFPLVYGFIERIFASGKAVLINCYAGMSRSTTLITSYLMRKQHMSADKAMKLVKSKRPCFDPNPGFIKQLYRYETVLRRHKIIK